jgi:hypothetical protein
VASVIVMYDSTAAMQGVGAAKKLVPGPSPVLLLQCKQDQEQNWRMPNIDAVPGCPTNPEN